MGRAKYEKMRDLVATDTTIGKYRYILSREFEKVVEKVLPQVVSSSTLRKSNVRVKKNSHLRYIEGTKIEKTIKKSISKFTDTFLESWFENDTNERMFLEPYEKLLQDYSRTIFKLYLVSGRTPVLEPVRWYDDISIFMKRKIPSTISQSVISSYLYILKKYTRKRSSLFYLKYFDELIDYLLKNNTRVSNELKNKLTQESVYYVQNVKNLFISDLDNILSRYAMKTDDYEKTLELLKSDDDIRMFYDYIEKLFSFNVSDFVVITSDREYTFSVSLTNYFFRNLDKYYLKFIEELVSSKI